ncbi:MAG: XdhC family protein [Phenylobacterium sp.]|nr:MAG: XdhC family protein [Phenylobacterium sp.]
MPLTLPEWPTFGWADDMRPAMRAARAAGEVAALVTLHTVIGGGPRPPGAQMLLSPSVASGFLSGGCVEGDIAIHAARTIEDGRARHLAYGDGSPWKDIQLLCGARIEILVERVTPDDRAVEDLLNAAGTRRPVQWITDGDARRIAPSEDVDAPPCAVRAEPFELRLRYDPVPRLAVIGSDPVALAIAALGSQSGFETTLVRPQGPAAPPPLSNVAYSRASPAEALEALTPDRWTAIAVATHDWEIDQAALLAALPSDASYVGVLGAGRRVVDRLDRLRAAGLDEPSLQRLRAPIGIDLGGKAPWEIAVSVIGEIVAERHAAVSGSVRRAALSRPPE